MFHITLLLLLLLLLCPFRVFLVDTVVAQGFATTTTTVCNGTASDATVVLNSGMTYVVMDCTITMMFITDSNTYLLQDVAIVVRGGSALPVVQVTRMETVRNVTMDISDVVYDAATATTTAMSTRVIFFDEIVTAETISITLTNVQIYHALDVSIVNATVAQTLNRFSVVLVNCKLRNVTTSGLVVASGNQNTTTASSLSLTVIGGVYSLLFIAEGFGGVLMQLRSFLTLKDAELLARSVFISVKTAPDTDFIIKAAAIAKVIDTQTVTNTHVEVENVTVVGVLTSSHATVLSVVEIRSLHDGISDSSVIVGNSQFIVQAGSAVGVYVGNMNELESVRIEVHHTAMELIAYGQVGYHDWITIPIRLAEGVVAAAVDIDIVQSVVDCTLVVSDCNLIIRASSSSVVQNYSTVSCTFVLWNAIRKTAALNATLQRVAMNVSIHESSDPMIFSSYTPALGLLISMIAAFATTASALERSTIAVDSVTILSDVVITPPTVPTTSHPLLMPAPLRSAEVSIAIIAFISNGTSVNISVKKSRVVVQQLRFLTSPSDAVSVGSCATDCDAICLSNVTGILLFYLAGKRYSPCVSSLIGMLGPVVASELFPSDSLTNVQLSVRDCYVEAAARDPTLSGLLLFAIAMSLSATVTNLSISVMNVSNIGLPAARTGPVMALGGTTAVGLHATFQNVTGFSLGMAWSEPDVPSVIQSGNIFAIAVDTSGGVILAGNLTSVTELMVTLRNCVMSGDADRGLFGDRFIQWLAAPVALSFSTTDVASPSSVIVLSECNMWNGRPLTLPLARRLLREAHNAPPGVVAVRTEGDITGDCIVTSTLEFVPPLPMPRVSSTTSAVAVATMALSAMSATSTTAVTGVIRLQAVFGALQVGRRCYQISSSGGSNNDDSSNDVGSAVFDNPLQLAISVGISSLQYAAGCVIGNTMLILVMTVGLNVIGAPKITQLGSHVLSRIPGNAVIVLMLLITPVVTSSIALMTGSSADVLVVESNLFLVIFGSVGTLLYAVGSVASVMVMMRCFPLRAVACNVKRSAASLRVIVRLSRLLFEETSRWVPSREPLLVLDPVMFRRRFGVLFVGYRSDCHWYAAADVAVPVLTGAMCGLPAGSVSCSLVLYVLLAIASFACMGSVLLRPCMTHWDNLWAVVGNGLSLVVTGLIVAVRMDTANTVTTALAWMSLVPALTLVAMRLYRLLEVSNACSITNGPDDVSAASQNGHDRRWWSPKCVNGESGDDNIRAASSISSLNDALFLSTSTAVETTANDSLMVLLSFICSRRNERV